MRIAGPASRPPTAQDVAAALTGAVGLLGQRPALTGLRPDGRREQGFASLAGWVAKGANLLTIELELGPGSRVALAGPAGWPLAAVTLSAWWIGATVVPASAASASSADVSVLHASSSGPATAAGGERFWFGDGLDGTGDAPSGPGEQWTDAVTPHGDRPPPAAHDSELLALVDDAGSGLTQAQLLRGLIDDEGGALGITRSQDEDVLARADAPALLAALALRPLVTGSATVLIDADDEARDAHGRAERIVRWYA
jgi:hypothetical protein